jgi:hypothetical protein
MRHPDQEFDPDEAMSEVVDAAQMYLSECDISSLAVIPQRCMPYPIISAEDVELYAHKLRKECVARKSAGEAVPDELEAMREFFTRAARVIYLLRLKGDAEGAEATIPPPRARSTSLRSPRPL